LLLVTGRSDKFMSMQEIIRQVRRNLRTCLEKTIGFLEYFVYNEGFLLSAKALWPYNSGMADTIDYSRKLDAYALGVDAAALRNLEEIFLSQIADGLHTAAQMVVLLDGKVLFDRAAGSFRGQNKKKVTQQTPFYCFSVTKAFTAMCVHKLIEEGKIALEAPVAEYWPAFGKHGKEVVTVHQAFVHMAGIPTVGFYKQIPLWPFWGLITRNTANLKPQFPPGEVMAYHPISWGTIMGELVRRVSGMPLNEYFDSHFAQPLGLKNTWLKLPFGQLKRTPPVLSAAEDQKFAKQLFNFPPIRRALLPAGSLHSTAREMAIFYHMLVSGGTYAGQQLLKPETIKTATTLQYRGVDRLNGRETLWGYGFHLGGRENIEELGEPTFGARSTVRSFGHGGNRSSLAWADHDHKLVVAFTCNQFLSNQGSRQRWIALNNAVWDIVESRQ
jgi:CubicO group peptidase (beta-lactamase class C family)